MLRVGFVSYVCEIVYEFSCEFRCEFVCLHFLQKYREGWEMTYLFQTISKDERLLVC